jgi:hypothetical protein
MTKPRGGQSEAQDIESLRTELERRAAERAPGRWNADPQEAQRSVAELRLTLIESRRKFFEEQAIRRLDAGTLTAAETEALGLALMRLEETIHDLADRFGLGADRPPGVRYLPNPQ